MKHDRGVPIDAELVDSYQRNQDLNVINTLLKRHVERTRGLIYGMVLDESDADDLLQETFLNAVRGLPRFDGRSAFSTWLYRIAVNTTRRFFQSRGRSRHVAEGDLTELRGTMADEPEHRAATKELHNDITAALATLSPRLRAAIVLTVIEGLPTKEVAEIEECAPETIRWRVHEARKILKQQLAEHLKQ